jgi:hypothetical protein
VACPGYCNCWNQLDIAELNEANPHEAGLLKLDIRKALNELDWKPVFNAELAIQRTINWYKKYRTILNSDIIQLRRADGRDWDGFLHVSPSLQQKGLLMVYNPLKEKITRTINVPLYYTGLTDKAVVKIKDSNPFLAKLNRKYEIELTLSIEPENYIWVIIE